MKVQINTLEKCIEALERLKAKGYFLEYGQYSWNDPNGFIMGFMNKSLDRIELCTYIKEIQDYMLKNCKWDIKE